MTRKIAVGIDIGGTNTDFGLVDREGKCYVKKSIRTDISDNVETFLDILCDDLKKTIA